MWTFNEGDDYVAVTEDFVRDRGIVNLQVGGNDIVVSYDTDAQSLGIWHNDIGKPIHEIVDIHGRVGGKNSSSETLERVNNVKAGCFWCVVATFFPSVRVNPEE